MNSEHYAADIQLALLECGSCQRCVKLAAQTQPQQEECLCTRILLRHFLCRCPTARILQCWKDNRITTGFVRELDGEDGVLSLLPVAKARAIATLCGLKPPPATHLFGRKSRLEKATEADKRRFASAPELPLGDDD